MRKMLPAKRTRQDRPTPPSPISDENFKIFLRIKPFTDPKPILTLHSHNKVEITSPYYSISDADKIYHYEEVFNPAAHNHEVFSRTIIAPIDNALKGFNSTVFIYGMTGAGKTHTMFGSFGGNSSRDYEEEGLVSMAIDHMFDLVQKEPTIRTQIDVSFYEIYNESINDLLQEEARQVNIMEDPVRGVFLGGLTEVSVEERTQTKDVIIAGIEKRAMNATKSNQVSSRSHAILQFSIRRYYSCASGQAQVSESKFFMIDLAGNEKTSTNESKRFIEGVNINKSLLTLGKCLSILADNKNSYVPFRESKLTRILKESLGGNSKTVMIACVSAERKFYEETLNTLKYSTLAKKIKNKGIKHNIKTISKEEIPNHKPCISKEPSSEFQHKIKVCLGSFLTCIEQKSKVERISEDLEASRQANEELARNTPDNQLFIDSITKIEGTMKKLSRVYERHLEKAETSFVRLMEVVNLAARQKQHEAVTIQDQTRQINRLMKIVKQQETKIKYLSAERNYLEQAKVETPDLTSTHLDSLVRAEDHCGSIMTQMSGKENLHTFNQTQQTQRSLGGRNKKLTINCHFQDSARSVTHNLNTSILTDKSRNSHKYKAHREIVINLQPDQPKSGKKEDFIKRLRETDKKARGGTESSEISALLEEQQCQQYQLGNVEQSMIRKLRFLEREKGMQKSSSLNRFPLRSGSTSKNPNLRVN